MQYEVRGIKYVIIENVMVNIATFNTVMGL